MGRGILGRLAGGPVPGGCLPELETLALSRVAMALGPGYWLHGMSNG